MSGRIVYEPSTPSACERGNCEGKIRAPELRPGTIWKCDECGKQWVVVQGAQYNESYQAWRVLTERNRDGLDR